MQQTMCIDGEKYIKRAIAQIETINETVKQSANIIQQLGERSQEISHILNIIT
ncbi:hypothetical protein [Halalkalibacter flavus]|uniref:hypothetical protein n=1 Tax=Halalkalibacter flavus TaxID=3090668 RepID=UPI002FC5BEA0